MLSSIHTIGIHTYIPKHTIGTKNNSDTKERKISSICVTVISVFRSSVRSHATHAIAELKKAKDNNFVQFLED